MFPTLLAIVAIAAFAVVYWFPLRRWFARWGTAPDELTRVLAGDAVIAEPTHSATHAVTVRATASEIWPWLVQLGYQRGGLYSYDWLDRLFGILDRPSASRILPEFQHLSVGDTVPLGPRQALTVRAIEPNRALVLSFTQQDFEWVWQFALYSLGRDGTRLVTRGTEHVPPGVGSWLFMRVMEPAAFIMTRKMLLNLKQRAEALHAETGAGSSRPERVAA